MRAAITAAILLVAMASPALSSEGRGAVLGAPPDTVEPSATYVIYLHGAILESEGPEAVHPDFGRYEYAAILDAMASSGVIVLSDLREAGTDGAEYAAVVASWVDSLLSEGVAPERVTVIGFSKGGGIAMRACSDIGNERINYVFMACCPRRMKNWPDERYAGRVLCIYEASDTYAGSCRGAVLGASGDSGAFPKRGGSAEGGGDGTALVVYEELEIDTGLKHGAFYRPLDVWLGPAIDWAVSEMSRAGR